ncbi:hypothetical protein QE152_g39030 [Popillia japonica]|uniref:Double jelly roll-like domain-containing protein n=1 Tax=Popillia japonica TaxID=7064 RepID=A0AAW1HV46_POPJA
MLMGFAEDVKQILMNVPQELVLKRCADDSDVIYNSVTTEEVKLIITNIVWRVPHVKVGISRELALTKLTTRNTLMELFFRGWEIHENPGIPQTTKHSWAIKTAPHLETPSQFKLCPLIGIDCSHQEDAIHRTGVEVRIEFTTKESIPKDTTAYCLILHNKMYEYSPFNKVVRRKVGNFQIKDVHLEDWLDIAKVNLQTMVKKNFIILDFQWYRFNSDIILPKELASCDSDFKRSHFVFRPVFSFGALTIADQHVANYAFYKHHGLKWTEGYTPLSEFDDIVRKLCADAEVENQRQNEHVAALAKTGQDVCGQLQTPPDLPRSMPDLYYDIAGMNFTPQDGPNVETTNAARSAAEYARPLLRYRGH